jgi:23S rRNA (uracil1939-C5)-methyltransferase
VLGFHGRGSTAIVETPGCRILTPRLLALRPALVDLVALAASRAGEMLLTVTDAAGGLDLLVEGARPLDLGLREALARWAAGAGVARLSWGAEPVVQAAAPWVAMGRARVLPPPGAFLQPTAEGEAALVAAVRRALGGARRVLDLFAGCGTFALPLAEDAQVHAVEGDGAMTAALLAGARGAAGLRRVTATARDLFRRPLAGAELEGFDAAVIDPPRQGAEAQVAALAAARLPVIAYVSCNPASFARDARRLVAAGYGMAPPLVIDQFRWSAHVELVTAFRRR